MDKRKEQIKQEVLIAEHEENPYPRCAGDTAYNGVNSAYGLGFIDGAEWADKNPKSKYNLSDVDYIVNQLDGIINTAEHMTTGNFAHNRASILLYARIMKKRCVTLIE